jgi:hypothetical protein
MANHGGDEQVELKLKTLKFGCVVALVCAARCRFARHAFCSAPHHRAALARPLLLLLSLAFPLRSTRSDATHYPQPGDAVHVQFIGKFLDGTVFDKSEPGRPFEFILGRGQVIQGWEEGVALMSTGQVAELTIPPRLGYGYTGYPPVIDPDTTLVYEIELITFGQLPPRPDQ